MSPFPSDRYNLAVENSTLARQWHPTRNGSLSPRDFSPKSNKKAWWLCKNGHEWEATINSRAYGAGRPYCANTKVGEDNNLQAQSPEIATEWHPTKNRPLIPRDVMPGSQKKVWWKCKKGHEYQAIISDRRKGGCPYCSRHRASSNYNLKRSYPAIAKQWHTRKNGSLSPSDVTPRSNRKVWWICEKGHDWEAVVGSRTVGRGCPFCSNRTSRPEIRVYAELAGIFSDVVRRQKSHGYELDLYLGKL